MNLKIFENFQIYDELFFIKFIKNLIDYSDKKSLINLYNSDFLSDYEDSYIKLEIIIYLIFIKKN